MVGNTHQCDSQVEQSTGRGTEIIKQVTQYCIQY